MTESKWDELKYWVWLNLVPGIGPIRYRYLIDHFGDPYKVFIASFEELSKVKGIDRRVASQIISAREKIKLEEEIKKIKESNIELLTYKDERYPYNLKQIFDFPPLLYVKGTIVPQDRMAIAIVGPRRPTNYGLSIAKKLARELASYGMTIVSGMAVGIDTAAHQGALEAGGRTIAVLGCGLNICYPRENKSLIEKIIAQGAILSELPSSTPPLSENFPPRNRIISGLSLGVIVVEAGEKSGALITANCALDQGREVFAVPGNITATTSKGTNNLIKQGAKLIDSAKDVIDELGPLFENKLKFKEENILSSSPVALSSPLSIEEENILKLLDDEPKHIDFILEKTQINPSLLAQYLLELELKGKIMQLSGKRFIKV